MLFTCFSVREQQHVCGSAVLRTRMLDFVRVGVTICEYQVLLDQSHQHQDFARKCHQVQPLVLVIVIRQALPTRARSDVAFPAEAGMLEQAKEIAYDSYECVYYACKPSHYACRAACLLQGQAGDMEGCVKDNVCKCFLPLKPGSESPSLRLLHEERTHD
jgi:hypothetical protein